MKRLLLLVLFCAGCSASHGNGGASPRLAISDMGGEKGNGAETISDVENSAWFRKNPFSYVSACVMIDPKFGASRETINAAIETAEKAWTDYFQLKHINVPIQQIQSWGPLPDCQGGENLIYAFGAMTPEIASARAKFSEPVGFAYRDFFDIKSGVSQGFVWVASQGSLNGDDGEIYPNWSQPYNLAGVLMHELGHVYGVDHVPLTIMDQRIADFLKLDESERKERLSGIDSYRDLYTCIECPISRNGFLGFSDDEDPASGVHSAVANFQLLTGHAPVGPVMARIEGLFTGDLTLQVDDFASTTVFKLELANSDGTGLSSVGESEAIFRVAAPDASGVVRVSAIQTGSHTLYGQIKTEQGQTLPLIVEMNMSTTVKLASGPKTVDGLVLKTFVNGSPRILFDSIAY